MSDSLTQHLIHHRLLYCCASVLLCLVAMSGLRHISFDADPERYFTDTNPHLALLYRHQAIYGSSDNLLLVLDTGQAGVFSQSGMAQLSQLHHQAQTLPYVSRVDSLVNFPFSRSIGDTLVIEPLAEDFATLPVAERQAREQAAMGHPSVAGRLLSHDGKLAMVYLSADLPPASQVGASVELYEKARLLAQKLEKQHAGSDVLISGRIANRAVTHRLSVNETLRLAPLMYLVIFGLLWWLLRSFFAMLAVMLITTLSCLASLGLAMYSGIVLNLLSMTAGNIIITLSIAHCVHVLTVFLHYYRQGWGKTAAVTESYRLNLRPVAITSLTTIIGFASMNLSAMPPAHDLGNITSLGVAFAFVLSLTVLPCLLLAMPISPAHGKVMATYHTGMARLAGHVIRHRHYWLTGCLLAAATMAMFVPQNNINDRFTDNIKEPHPFRSDNARIDTHFGGLYHLQYSIPVPAGETVSDAAWLAELDGLVRWLRKQDGVRHVFAYTDVLRQLNMAMHDGDPAADIVPAGDALAAQYLLLLELAQRHSDDMRHYLAPDRQSGKLMVSLADMDSKALIALQQRIDDYMQQQMPKAMHSQATSLSLMWAWLGESVLLDSLKSALFALLLISLLLLLLFRSLRYGLISLVPNLLPAVIGYGFWALYNGSLDLGQMMVLTLTTGIVVDDTVHLLSKYLHARRSGLDTQSAVVAMFTNSGPALWITTLVLVAGFALLTFSAFLPTAHLGLLTAVIIAAALLFDLLLLPPLLLWMDGRFYDKALAKRTV